MLRVLDLFAGVGGFTEGLEVCGAGKFETVAFCEQDKDKQAELHRTWPNVPIYDDVTELTHDQLKADGIGRIDLITAGFPCTDISVSGKGRGIEGEKSGLWSEVARLLGEIRPKYILLENSPELLGRGVGKVYGEVAQIGGYRGEWMCIPAWLVGTPIIRDRWFFLGVAHKDGVLEKNRFAHVQQNILDNGYWKEGSDRLTPTGCWDYWESRFGSQPRFCEVDDGI